MTYSKAIDNTLRKTKANISRFNGLFPHVSEGGKYSLNANEDWTNGFWSGILWLSYEYSNDNVFKVAAQETVDSFRNRWENNIVLDMHDIGFLYTPSSLAQWKIEEKEDAKELTIAAADKLMQRYRPNLKIFQAWGPKDDPDNGGRIIIDCLMNMPLLFWASKETGNQKYKEAATQFVDIARKFLIRGDNSSYHTFYFDQKTGDAVKGATAQGYQNGSTWSRGQSWAIYGFALAYYYTKDSSYLETSIKTAQYFVKQLPENYIAPWDFDAPTNSDTKPDSSACAIAVCGMHELSNLLTSDHPEKGFLDSSIHHIMAALIKECETQDNEQGLLDHGSYSVQENISPDDFVIWGDYFYLEALMRLEKKHRGYWTV
ncbi:glucuronyl hydrolase [Halolactibacillus alkaliphilus]|uniref:Glucuronyl hydrolase n=1 Tax=Halolactibacillus alkaliphilus TaxID=442899 RepID=A0A511WYI8_9BACI|nr:glycoside hydrolase family 88 protein [Halolactibacillus alkaliphilus]GEN55538.1 glucuronyl hydrolase [Halolactibacillus alkaliphilus]GGN64169.1 glucuronyl hydrolase [Halolactibacillus alkaliphilus]SFO61742.1 unsaturated chondroitin disaccharide hydrolase [Halolactibacillus alkaliphilus]